jgi:DNA-binding LacI/PurR family transcriptional regulator
MQEIGTKKIAGGRTTLKDIARLAGVSQSTASAVLNGKGIQNRISIEAQRRVREVALQHDYAPNLLVRSLQHGRTHVLSIYNSFGSSSYGDPYIDRLATSIERTAGRHGYDVLVHCNFTRPADETYRMLNGRRADGLIWFGPTTTDPLLPLLRGSRLPIVLLARRDEKGVLSSVCDDMADGMRQVADAFVDLGHRRIAVLVNAEHTDSGARADALRALLAERGVTVPGERVISVTGEEPSELEDVLRSLLAASPSPTALFCWHDRLGYEVLEACERLGVSVPDHLSLIGYDGLHWPSTSRHMLASIDVHLSDLAEEAVRLLDDHIEGKCEAPVEKVLPVSLSRGTTLGPPREDS